MFLVGCLLVLVLKLAERLSWPHLPPVAMALWTLLSFVVSEVAIKEARDRSTYDNASDTDIPSENWFVMLMAGKN